MAQSVTTYHYGRLHLFTPNWEVISKDPWKRHCVQGYTIELTEWPAEEQAPRELNFTQEEAEALSTEVEEMSEKRAKSPVPREQEAN